MGRFFNSTLYAISVGSSAFSNDNKRQGTDVQYDWTPPAGGDIALLAASGSIEFASCHEHDAVGPMTGVISPSMPVHIIENVTDGNREYCTVNEGLGKVLCFGAFSSEVLERLRWIEIVYMPAFLKTDLDEDVRKQALAFIQKNENYFLNLSMPSPPASLDAGHGVEGSTIVMTMARNGVEFRKPTQRGIAMLSVDEAREHIQNGQFPAGSMLPKVESALSFVTSRLGREAIAGKTGTRFVEEVVVK
ncbi:oxamate carbamoyltransferase subunit AllG family protein [Exiguobacterium profundum]|uniref:oxamate carbamoyltransferase subunit AllG family protein n=1 Tax=Exiguobacterium profundum TaxID=307643 RepID=UPI0028A0774F|nr:DUF1116 domain-containing protein [Exiguobacterium profundum]